MALCRNCEDIKDNFVFFEYYLSSPSPFPYSPHAYPAPPSFSLGPNPYNCVLRYKENRKKNTFICKINASTQIQEITKLSITIKSLKQTMLRNIKLRCELPIQVQILPGIMTGFHISFFQQSFQSDNGMISQNVAFKFLRKSSSTLKKYISR
jgi:hypothetical protein